LEKEDGPKGKKIRNNKKLNLKKIRGKLNNKRKKDKRKRNREFKKYLRKNRLLKGSFLTNI